MSQRVFKIRRKDGSVAITRLLGPGKTIEGEIAKWAPEVQAQVESAEPIEEKDIPCDRTFRNAWGHDLKIRMPQARGIWRDKIRAARASILAKLDVEYQRADETNDVAEKQRIAARKQALRDAPQDPRIESAQTPEELKAVVPTSELAGKL